MKRLQVCFLLLLCLMLTLCSDHPSSVNASELNYQPKILLLTAHPDDEMAFAATVFKTTHLLDGIVDIVNITNGEGGYRFSTLANYIYDLKLDEEETGRANLPEIRKQELKAAGKILGLHEYFFLEQVDDMFSTDIEIPLSNWDTEFVEQQLTQIMTKGGYDFIFTFLPTPATHSHHQATTLLALRAFENLESDQKPVILGVGSSQFTMLDGYPITKIIDDAESFTFDRSQRFGFDERLDYSIIVRWVAAEHKSQGTVQFATGQGIERYSLYAVNPESAWQKTKDFFVAVNEADIYF